MALPKVLGIETEYGILVRGADVSPVLASTLVVNAHVDPRSRVPDHNSARADIHAPVAWDPASEYPQVGEMVANRVLANGARLYVDHAHPEYSTPECSAPMQAVEHDVAGEMIVHAAASAAARDLPEGTELYVHKNNSDGKGNSYGCHENYLVPRALPFAEIVRVMSVHLVTRMVLCGAGKVGGEHLFAGDQSYRVSQRADFFEEPLGLETTVRRPVVNTRDEPHADPSRYRRLHVIAGDANMSQWATWMKLGTTALVLSALEDGHIPAWLTLADPVGAMHAVGSDTDVDVPLLLSDGRTATAVDLQSALAEACASWLSTADDDTVGGEGGNLLSQWEESLAMLRTEPALLVDRVDWLAKLRVLEGFRERHGCTWGDARMRAIDLQYHDTDPRRSLAPRVGLRSLADPQRVMEATTQAPASTRAWFRGECIARWPRNVVTADWDSLVLEWQGREYQVDMPEPLRGTRELTGELFARCVTPGDLLAGLGGPAARMPDTEPGW